MIQNCFLGISDPLDTSKTLPDPEEGVGGWGWEGPGGVRGDWKAPRGPY